MNFNLENLKQTSESVPKLIEVQTLGSSRLQKIMSKTGIAVAAALTGTLLFPQPASAEKGNPFELEFAALASPSHGGKGGFGVGLHWNPVPRSHDDPHVELGVDLGVSFFRVAMSADFANQYGYQNMTSVTGTEFHLAPMAALILPLSDIVNLELGAGLGLYVSYHSLPPINQNGAYSTYDPSLNPTTQTAPLMLFHGGLSFEVSEQVGLFFAYSPHIPLIPVSNEIPANKGYDVDHEFVAGIGIKIQ